MRTIRKKLFILSYLGGLLLIMATVVPITKFNNQSFAFIDQFFYLSFAIIILSAINIVLVTLKKYKLSLIPTILNIAIISYGVYDILTIEGLKSTPNFAYGIALILYPIGMIFSIIGGLLTTNKNSEQKETKTVSYEEKMDNNLEVSEPPSIIENTDVSLNYEEQIPLSNILNKNKSNEDDLIEEINIDNRIEDEISNTIDDNIENSWDDKNLDNDINVIQNTVENIEQNVDLNSNDENNSNVRDDSIETINNSEISMLDENDDLLEEIEEYEYKDDDDFFEEITEDTHENSDDNIVDSQEEVFVDDDSLAPIIEPIKNENQEINNEIPDLSLDDENIMTNNIQIEDKPKPEFMAINPSDIKIDEKKSLFKKKEKKEEDPLKHLMNRNIPMTLGRTCQFCSTQLGDDERICPICGRIN